MQPEIVADYQCETGEGPLWHAAERRLYWADIPRGRMFRYDPATGSHEQFYDGEVVGGFTIQADGMLLLFMARGAVAVWRDGKLDYIIDEIPEERDGRFNDVAADPAGRVFCGTMPIGDRLGKLYRLDLDGTITPVVDGVDVSNGIGFTPDERKMYYAESMARSIYVYDYDRDTGAIVNRSVLLQTPDDGSIPDGMTVDGEGYVWSARWDGSSLYRYTPEGVEDRRVAFPAKKVSSVIFGGDDLTDIYVTTAGGNNKAEEGQGAGALFRLNLGIRGKPEYLSRIGL